MSATWTPVRETTLGVMQTEHLPYVKVNQVLSPCHCRPRTASSPNFEEERKRMETWEFHCSLEYEVLAFNYEPN